MTEWLITCSVCVTAIRLTLKMLNNTCTHFASRQVKTQNLSHTHVTAILLRYVTFFITHTDIYIINKATWLFHFRRAHTPSSFVYNVQEVAGSNPVTGSDPVGGCMVYIFYVCCGFESRHICWYARLAQMAEHLPLKHQVTGSNPVTRKNLGA